jgi:hypothetical protein
MLAYVCMSTADLLTVAFLHDIQCLTWLNVSEIRTNTYRNAGTCIVQIGIIALTLFSTSAVYVQCNSC